MGGHAFPRLDCPRIPPVIYDRVKHGVTLALEPLFSQVVVPAEFPEKIDYGDIDFLVLHTSPADPDTSLSDNDWNSLLNAIRSLLDTPHGFRGRKNPDCMFFAIPLPDSEDQWIQVDVKMCRKQTQFEWQAFQLQYASISKLIGSMVKPLGLTVDPEGLHIRLAEIEETNFPGSMVWVTNKPKHALRIFSMNRSILNGTLKTEEEVYEHLTSSRLFNPAHFASRLAEVKYETHLTNRSYHWVRFIKEWMPRKYPDCCFAQDQEQVSQEVELQAWYKRTRKDVRETVFTQFPHVAAEYYARRKAFVEQDEEEKLQFMLTEAIPIDDTGYKNLPKFDHDVDHFESQPSKLSLKPVGTDRIGPWAVTVYLDIFASTLTLPSDIRAPPPNMSIGAKLLCMARWTAFSPCDGKPYLLESPREKGFQMNWTVCTNAGLSENVLVEWAKSMWWHVWIRQYYTNFVGLMKKREEKKAKKAENRRVRETESEQGLETKVDGEKRVGKIGEGDAKVLEG